MRKAYEDAADVAGVVASMTMGQDMSALFPDVVACLNIQVLEVKKMVYLCVSGTRASADVAATSSTTRAASQISCRMRSRASSRSVGAYHDQADCVGLVRPQSADPRARDPHDELHPRPGDRLGAA